eukprot:5425742-Pleurochrysis_carterae.AAC.2
MLLLPALRFPQPCMLESRRVRGGEVAASSNLLMRRRRSEHRRDVICGEALARADARGRV